MLMGVTTVAILAHSGRILRGRGPSLPQKSQWRNRVATLSGVASPVQRVYELAAAGDLNGARTAMDLLTIEDGARDALGSSMALSHPACHLLMANSQLDCITSGT